MPIPERDSEHSMQLRKTCLTELFIQVDDGFRVRPSPELMSARQIPAVQFREIVDLAVKGDPDGSILVGQRLVSPGQIDDRETPKAEPDRRGGVKAFIVGA